MPYRINEELTTGGQSATRNHELGFQRADEAVLGEYHRGCGRTQDRTLWLGRIKNITELMDRDID
jgi:hypothetical protein